MGAATSILRAAEERVSIELECKILGFELFEDWSISAVVLDSPFSQKPQVLSHTDTAASAKAAFPWWRRSW